MAAISRDAGTVWQRFFASRGRFAGRGLLTGRRLLTTRLAAHLGPSLFRSVFFSSFCSWLPAFTACGLSDRRCCQDLTTLTPTGPLLARRRPMRPWLLPGRITPLGITHQLQVNLAL